MSLLKYTVGTPLDEDGIFFVDVLQVHRLHSNSGRVDNAIIFTRKNGEKYHVVLPWMPKHDAFFYKALPLACTLVAIRESDGSLSIHFTRDDWSAVVRLWT